MIKNKKIIIDKSNESINISLDNKELKPLQNDEVRIKNIYSDLNYKDILATKINSGVIKNYPIVPGIDLCGKIVESKSNSFKKMM